MNVHARVNTYLRSNAYSSQVARPGAKKGKPKPAKRVLDAGFIGRLKAAMRAKDWGVPRLASEARCTRQALHKYLKPHSSKTMEAHLLFAVSDALEISARWLLMGGPGMERERALTPDQLGALALFGQLDAGSRSFWIEQGESLRRRQPALAPSVADPFTTMPAKAKV